MIGHAFLNADNCGRICLVLFHSLWQMGLAAMLAWLLGRKWRGSSAEWAYWAHVAALVVGLAAMPVTYLSLGARTPEMQGAMTTDIHLTIALQETAKVNYEVKEEAVDNSLVGTKRGEELTRANGAAPIAHWSWVALAPWFVGVYAFGAVMMFVRLGIGIARSERMRRCATPITAGAAAAAISRIADAWRMRAVPLIACAERIAVPTVIGLMRPMILVPATALTALTEGELELILEHELAHVRRFDLWVNMLQRLGEAVLFFNPAVWYLSRRISTLREYCCDEAVCRRVDFETGEVQFAYVSALLRVVELAQPARLIGVNAATLAADGGSPSELRRRVASLLGEPMNEPLRLSRGGLVCAAALATVIFLSPDWFRHAAYAAADGENKEAKTGEESAVDDAKKLLSDVRKSRQQMLKLPILITDPDGKPVANATVTPWALRSSQGHGWWSKDNKDVGVGPEPAVTDENGVATVLYPKYEDFREKIATIGVSVNVDSPDFAYLDAEHIDVPLESKEPYQIKLKPGVGIEIRPLVEGRPMPLDNLFAMWSDGRSYKPEAGPERTKEGSLRFRGMSPGTNSILLVKLEGERATYFSKITDFELKAGEEQTLDIPLEPSVTVRGKISDDVPRPIKAGWIKMESLDPTRDAGPNRRVTWYSWSPIKEDGTFTIDGWSAKEPIQLIAVCDGYVATSGKAPDVVKDPPDPAHDPFGRPQVFEPQDKEPIEVPMTPMGKCEITAVDEDNKPVAGVRLAASPNVQWWNDGSQIYAWPLVKCERVLHTRDYNASAENDAYQQPFRGETDAKGRSAVYLPAGRQDLVVFGDVYELPVFLGRRDVRVPLESGKTQEVTLHLQPSGTEQLGDWDKLAGVVFGCSTREGRRICALPEVRKKMDEFEQRFRDGKSQHDPQLLSDAYTMVADAFVGVGDKEEAAKWRAKAAAEAAKVKQSTTE